jgi:hypothetical protein
MRIMTNAGHAGARTPHRQRRAAFSACASLLAIAAVPAGAQDGSGLLFRASADKSMTADVAVGDAVPNFRTGITIVPDGAIGGAARWADDGYVAWRAPGNMRAERGTLAFFWRPHQAVGEAPFAIFRAGFADHTSWDMGFLRIDWNGHGFDGFVTDANLSRVRVSWRMPDLPAPDAWHHIAFAWDETTGVRLYVDGKLVARKDQAADLDAGLDQFGLAGRVMSPHQVQSRYNFMRGSDLDEIRVYDHMLGDAGIAALAAKGEPPADPADDTRTRRTAWLHRYGWDRASPPPLTDPVTRIRKVEFADAKDLKEWMWKGVDGIAETTWPGVYNRSRLPGRDDYFELPDWNVYVEGGKRYDLTVPPGETVNRVEIRGAAYGTLDWSGKPLATRPRGVVRSVDSFAPRTGGTLSFVNQMQEQPIQEIWAYDVGAGTEPAGSLKLSYTIDANAAPDLPALAPLNAFIAGRFAPDERATVLALPSAGVKAAIGAGAAGASGTVQRDARGMPIVHILIPSNFAEADADKPLARAWDYGWQNVHDGLDGIAIDLPAMKLTPDARGLVPLNIRVKDPLWPGRDMIDVSVSVRPGEARTLWLDLRDRILPQNSLWLTIASAASDFDAHSLSGAKLRLVFKPRAEALKEHVADRLNQVKDNWGFLVEEHTASKREGLYARVFADISDLLRVDPDNALARTYWSDIDYRPENAPPVTLAAAPAGMPLWAFRQLEDLKLSRRFVDWWIDHRQVPYGDFGGGISDDTDLTEQWPGLALMGVEPDRINASLRALSDAVYRNGMIVDGLGYITTDELHVYEEGINSNGERLYLNWGEPKAVERLMDTVRAMRKVLLVNPAGHMHFASSWYGARKIYRDDPWSWQKPYAFNMLQPAMLVGLYNGNPAATGQVIGVMDGWLAHGKQGADGGWSFPNEINWRTDAERAGDGGGIETPMQTAWGAYRLSGDAKYLRPIAARVAKAGTGTLNAINEDALALAPQGGAWRAAILKKAGSDPYSRYVGWQASGDLAALEQLHADSITTKTQRLYMMTEGHWWSDRVESAMDILQRERLGGVALVRGQEWPGHTVSWRFAEPDAAEQVAILLPGATPDRFRVLAYNGSDHVQSARMTGWDVTAGTWSMTRATSGDGGKTLTAPEPATTVTLERSAGLDVAFAPKTLTVYDFALTKPGTPVADRPDLGIGADDVTVRGGRVTVTVHSLGARPTAAGTATLIDAAGHTLASVPVPPLAAPLDLLPRTAVVRLPIPARATGVLSVRVALADGGSEVTMLNNAVPLAR